MVTKEQIRLLEGDLTNAVNALELMWNIVDQMMPSVGGMSIDIGMLNQGLMDSRAVLVKAGVKLTN